MCRNTPQRFPLQLRPSVTRFIYKPKNKMVRTTLVILVTVVTIVPCQRALAQNLTVTAGSWEGYSELSGCMQWCYDACNSSHTSTVSFAPASTSLAAAPSTSCTGPIIFPVEGIPSKYPGLLKIISCTTAACICNLQGWIRALQAVYDCGRMYCALRLGAPGLPDNEFSKTFGVLQDFCSANGYKLSEWLLDVGKNYQYPATQNNTCKFILL
jgi:hypothetical protein